MSNFSGIQKNAKPFKPQAGGTVAGIWPGRVEKADQPVEPTTPYGSTDGAGESEIGLRGQVEHPDASGGSKYLAGKIARVYRQLTADGAGIENLSREERLALRNRLVYAVVDGVSDGGNQEPNNSASGQSTLLYVGQVAALLFGLIDELPGTPTFLTRSASSDLEKMVDKMTDGVECPHCHTINPGDVIASGASFNHSTGMYKFTCTSCAKKWDENPSLRLTKSAEPSLADLKKQLAEQVNILTERLRGLIARGSGVEVTERTGSGRFVTKNAGGNDPKKLLKHALDNGVAVPFSGADPRSEAERSSGSGRKFQPRS